MKKKIQQFASDLLSILNSIHSRIRDLIKTGELFLPFSEEQENYLTQGVFKMFTAMNLIMGDEVPSQSPIFLHVRYDYDNVVNAAGRLVAQGNKGQVLLDGSEGQHGKNPYPNGKKKVIWHGFSLWIGELFKRGVPMEQIRLTQPAYNTPDETKELLRIAQAEKWESVIIIGNSYQMLRIVLGTIKWMEKNNFWLKCYFHVPYGYEWTKAMKGPQGTDDGQLINQILAEYQRVPEYQLKNDLATLQEAINYIHYGRDSIVDGKLTQKLN